MKKYYRSFFITKEFIVNIPEGMSVEDFERWQEENVKVEITNNNENGVFVNDYSELKYAHPLTKQEVRKLKNISEPILHIPSTINHNEFSFVQWSNIFIDGKYDIISSDAENIMFSVRCPYGEFYIEIDGTEEIVFQKLVENSFEIHSIYCFHEVENIVNEYKLLWNSLSYPKGDQNEKSN